MKEIKRVVVPVDFMEHTDKLVDFAMGIAGTFSAGASFIHVVEHLELIGDYVHPSMGQMEKDLLDRAKKQMKEVVSQAAGKLPGAKISGHCVLGDTVDAIIQYAGDEAADLIIIGTHGRKGFEKVLLGSVAERVLRRSPCPILLFNPYH